MPETLFFLLTTSENQRKLLGLARYFTSYTTLSEQDLILRYGQSTHPATAARTILRTFTQSERRAVTLRNRFYKMSSDSLPTTYNGKDDEEVWSHV